MMTDLDRLLFCLTHGFPPEVTTALLRLADGDITLGDAHDEWESYECDTIPDHWTDRFGEVVAVLTGSDEPISCERCADWVHADDSGEVSTGDILCNDCISRYFTKCYECEEYHPDGDMDRVEDNPYCEGCRDSNCNYCDTCEEYYRYNDHDHEDGCECEAPRQRFRFPANGQGTVANDERLNVVLPKGTIDDFGLQGIRRLLIGATNDQGAPLIGVHGANVALDAIGHEWHGQKGNYTRRLSRELHTNHGVKIPAAVLTEVGNIAKAHSSDTSEWPIEFTRNLNMSASSFAHDDSCWWQSYYESRCALKNWGGIGLRVLDEYDDCTGRAWVQPLGLDMLPTHDALNARAYVVYNCYGTLDQAKAARIVAHLTGKTYRKIEYDTSPQYVNGNSGWLVADEETCQETASIYLSESSHDNFDAYSIPNSNEEIAA